MEQNVYTICVEPGKLDELNLTGIYLERRASFIFFFSFSNTFALV